MKESPELFVLLDDYEAKVSIIVKSVAPYQ